MRYKIPFNVYRAAIQKSFKSTEAVHIRKSTDARPFDIIQVYSCCYVVDGMTKGWSVWATREAYFTGPGSRLPSVNAKSVKIAEWLKKGDFESIGTSFSRSAKIKLP